ncbi:Transposase [Paracoccus tibetensis]|uniref:Transposase n=1 Tax=Paracoccus tibetensis TaxID=336292 RepID=A0A1G5DN22_9RHOB|nr:Transposase [Paracoccus tibetensis]
MAYELVGGCNDAPEETKPEEIVAKLRQVDVLVSRGQSVAEAVRSISVTHFTYYRWRKEFGGLKTDQVKRLKELEKDRASGSLSVREPLARERLRKAVSNLTLEKLILREAASGNFFSIRRSCVYSTC